MNYRSVTQKGLVTITSEAVATIAGISAMECYGVVGMASTSPTSGLVRLLKREHFTKGIKVKLSGDKAVIDLFVILQYGTKISVVADNIISSVKYHVEEQSGIKVEKVNLNIEGIRMK